MALEKIIDNLPNVTLGRESASESSIPDFRLVDWGTRDDNGDPFVTIEISIGHLPTVKRKALLRALGIFIRTLNDESL